MVTSEKLSIAGELLLGLKVKSCDTCVSNLTKTHCVNLKKFNCDRLPEGMWIMSKQFLSTTNHVMPNTLFEMFGEFSNQTGSEVQDTMVGWAFDNYRLLGDVCKVTMTQQKMSLQVWINKMADEQKSGDQIALYIPSHMYRRHAFVYTHMFWWTTLLYTLPIQEKDLMERCEIVLIFLKPGVFDELHKIRTPTASVTGGSRMVPSTLPPVIPQNTEQQSHDVMTTLTTPLVITGDATETKPVPPRSMDSQIVTCGNEDSNINTQSGQPIVSTRLNEQETTDTPASALPKIDIS